VVLEYVTAVPERFLQHLQGRFVLVLAAFHVIEAFLNAGNLVLDFFEVRLQLPLFRPLFVFLVSEFRELLPGLLAFRYLLPNAIRWIVSRSSVDSSPYSSFSFARSFASCSTVKLICAFFLLMREPSGTSGTR